MKLHARLVLISLFAILVPGLAVLVTAASIITQNRIRSRDESYARVIEGIRKETLDTEVRYAAGIRRLSADEYLTAKLYVYNKYWNYIDQGMLQTDILVLKGELEKFLLAEGIDTIAVYRTEYDRYVPVLIIGNPATIPDPVYRQMVDPAGPPPEYRQISDGLYMNFYRPVFSSGREIGLLVFQKSYNRSFFESVSLRYGVGLAVYLQGLFRYTSLPGIADAGVIRAAARSERGRFTGSYRHEERKFTYVGTYFDLGEQARGYLLAGGPLTLGLGELWGLFLQLSIVPLVCMLTAALVFLRWGNEILRRLIHSEKMAALGQFSAGVAHEINNPLGIVLNHVQLLRTGRLSPEEERDFLRRIEEEIRRMHRLLDHLLHGSADGELARRPLSLSRLAGEVAGFFAPKLRSGQVELLVEPFADKLPVVGDRDALKQVLFNVLKNAFQAVRRPGGRIRIRGESNDGQCLLAISDNGAGMDAEARRHLFEPFYTRKSGHGTGLGLALSLRIMERHGGTILVDSGPAGGTTVTLRLPRRQADGG